MGSEIQNNLSEALILQYVFVFYETYFNYIEDNFEVNVSSQNNIKTIYVILNNNQEDTYNITLNEVVV